MPALSSRTRLPRFELIAVPVALLLLTPILIVAMVAGPSSATTSGAGVAVSGDEGPAGTSPSDVFERRCDIDGAYRVIPLHPDVGGRIPSLANNVGSVVRLDEPLPPGTYGAGYVSYDGYPGRQWVTQPQEVWEAVFLAEETSAGILGTIGPTADLADEVSEAYQFTWPPGAITTITTTRPTNLLAIRNAAPPGAPSPNSVRPFCLVLFRDPPIDDRVASCSESDLILYHNDQATFGSTTGKLWSGAPSRLLGVLEHELQPGAYRVIAGSYDGHQGRAGETWETAERWAAEFRTADDRLVATSDPTPDLPDGPGFDEASWEGSVSRVVLDEPAGRFVARHRGSGSAPNSLHPLCLAVSWEDEPDLREVLGRNGFNSLRASPVTTFPPGTYQLDLLAEFTSGHATNAVGYRPAGDTGCQIVFDGPEGGRGLNAWGRKTFTVDERFALCLVTESETWSTDPADNPDGIEAARLLEPAVGDDVSYLVGFEDFLDGDFQDLVVQLRLTAAADPPAGLPSAIPGLETPWAEIGPEWLLTLVHGPVDGDDQPQGLYLVSPTGERWLLYADVVSATANSMNRILDWDRDERAALVSVSGPRDLNHVALVDLRYARSRALTERVGGIEPRASFYLSNAGGYFVLAPEAGGTKRVTQLAQSGGIVTTHGPSLPLATRVDWIETPWPFDLVIADALAVGGSRGRVTWIHPMPEGEDVVATEDCVPVRWVRAGLVAVCHDVAGTVGDDLWVIPLEGAPMWPLIHAEVSDLLGVDGFRDVHRLDDDRLVLESGVGDVWMLERGCGVPTKVGLPLAGGGLDVVGAIDDSVLGLQPVEGRLLRLPILGGSGDEAAVLLEGVADVARWDAHVAIGDDAFPTPPLSPEIRNQDTCDKLGPGGLALLSDLRWGEHDGFTRVVFEFEADAPSTPRWFTRYVDGPILREHPDLPPITGDGLLEVELRPSSRVDLTGPEPRLVYDGPTQIEMDIGGLEAIRLREDLENVLTWIIEIDGRRPYRAFVLADPPRLVIDVADG